MSSVRVHTLQWAVGVLCALIGMLALVTPRQFSAVTYAFFSRTCTRGAQRSSSPASV